MRKFKLSTLVLLGVATMGITACGGSGGGEGGSTSGGEDNPALKGPVEFWHNFGAKYSNITEDTLTKPIKADKDITFKVHPVGSYDKLLTEISYSIAQSKFPNVATGYPDHFANYANVGYPAKRTGILVGLDDYLANSKVAKEFKEKYGYELKDDYFPEYMKENTEIAYDANDNPVTIGLPFNKSTEVMGYNGVFYDFVKANEATYGEVKVPETWAEWATYGPRFRKAQLDIAGKYVKGTLGTPSTYTVVNDKPADDQLVLDFSEVTPKESAVLSWDSGANMFITLVRQYGSTFTTYTEADRKQKDEQYRHGYIEFYTAENKAKTLEAINMVLGLTTGTTAAPADLEPGATEEQKTAYRNYYEKQIFATPATFGTGYSSNAFAYGRVLFTVCSTGGLSYNINANQEFRIAPIPYKDVDHKFVISQGANITVFNQKCIADTSKSYTPAQMAEASFNAAVYMTTGDYQAKFATKTGYFPATKSASNSKIYQDFLKADTSDPIDRAYRDGAKINEDEYMNASKKWDKFVDPGFVGSSVIRTEVDGLINGIITAQKSTGFNADTWMTSFWNKPTLAKYNPEAK